MSSSLLLTLIVPQLLPVLAQSSGVDQAVLMPFEPPLPSQGSLGHPQACRRCGAPGYMKPNSVVPEWIEDDKADSPLRSLYQWASEHSPRASDPCLEETLTACHPLLLHKCFCASSYNLFLSEKTGRSKTEPGLFVRCKGW